MLPRWLKLTLMIAGGTVAVLVGGVVLVIWLYSHFRPDPARHAAPSPAPSTLVANDVSLLLEAIRAHEKVPALAAVVLRGDTIIASGVAGVREAGRPERATLGDAFHLGSDTKAMTATMIARLVEAGKLRWDTTLGEVFGIAVPTMDPAWRPVTLTQLLTHRAGLPAGLNAGGLWSRLRERRGTPADQRMELVRGVLALPPVHAPGTKFLYSNSGYAIAGAMAERVTGRSWEDLMQTELFQPLGITTAGFGPPGSPETHDQPRGHTSFGFALQPLPISDNPPAIAPAGAVHISLADWAKFAALHLRADANNPNRHVVLLRAETFDFLHRPAGGPGISYACGWSVTDRRWAQSGAANDPGIVLGHEGSNGWWHAYVQLAPGRDWAVLVVCNQGGDSAQHACETAALQLRQKLLTGQR